MLNYVAMKSNKLPSGRMDAGSLLAVMCFVSVSLAWGEIIPQTRRIDWNSAGVPGGIPARTTIYATLNPGATASQINSALASCPSNQVVFLNAGTYQLGGGLSLSRNGVTLRGAGPSQTILQFVNASPWAYIELNPGASENISSANIKSWTGGFTKGTTNITISDVGSLQVGWVVGLDELNDPSFVNPNNQDGSPCSYCSRTGTGERVRQLYVRVAAINGNTITIDPPLTYDFSSTRSPQIFWWGAPLVGTGIENLRIDGTSGAAANNFGFLFAYGCWAKNVESIGGDFAHFRALRSMRCELRDSYIHMSKGSGNQSYGSLITKSSFMLVENNIYQDLVGMMLLGEGSQGCVHAYNYATNITFSLNPSWMTPALSSHSTHTMMNLWEGNFATTAVSDQEHGSSSHNTYFRNRISGWQINKSQNTSTLIFNAKNRFMNVVGNVLGTAGYHNLYQLAGTPGDGDKAIFLIGFLTGDTSSLNGYDPLVLSTLLRHGNYDYVTRSNLWDSSISDRNVPASLKYSSKPAWFGNRPWPPVDPSNPAQAVTTNLPAGYRFVFGSPPPSGPVNNPPVASINATPTIGLPPLAVSFSSAGSSDPEGTALTYDWTFGDGTANSTVPNPNHTYSTAGSYFARLTVSDGTNTTTSSEINIRVGNQPPVIVASATPRSGPAPLAVTFSSSGTSDPESATLIYSWNFGDGSPVSTAPNPNHTYQANGVYAAQLTVSDGSTSVSSNLVITVSNGLIAAYDFDAGSGSSVVDASGNGNTGTINGATWATAGYFGRALSFNGVNAVVTINDSASLDLTGAMTIEAWVYPTSFNGDYQSILSKPIDSTFSGISYVLHGASRPSSLPSFATSVSSGNLMGNATLPLNTWSHLAGTYDGVTARFYINGVQVTSRAESGIINTSSEALRIGLSWAGIIDEVRIYNRALSATDVQRDMNTSIGGAARPSAPSGFRVVGP
jgi:PKD repeat protein